MHTQNTKYPNETECAQVRHTKSLELNQMRNLILNIKYWRKSKVEWKRMCTYRFFHSFTLTPSPLYVASRKMSHLVSVSCVQSTQHHLMLDIFYQQVFQVVSANKILSDQLTFHTR